MPTIFSNGLVILRWSNFHQEGSIKIFFFLQHLGLESLNPQSLGDTPQWVCHFVDEHAYNVFIYIYIHIYIHYLLKNATWLFGTADCQVSSVVLSYFGSFFFIPKRHPSLLLRHCKTRLRVLLRQLLARHGQDRHMLKIASSDSKSLDDTPQPELHLNLGGIFMEIIFPWAQDKLIPD